MNPASRKKTGIIFHTGLFAFLLAAFTGCVKQEFDVPPVVPPQVNFTANTTIDSLNKSFLPDTLGMMRVKTDMIIRGVVAANDESGNIYKNLYIQDNTGGLVLSLDRVDMYTTFKVGQRVFVKCKDLFLGQYGEVTQLGYPYNGKIGRIPDSMIDDHLFADSLPGKAPVADTLNIADVTTFQKALNKLVVIKNVRFESAGQPFVTGDATTNRNIWDAFGNQIVVGGEDLILRTSNYASFSASPLPEGVGAIRGILSAYNGQYQMYVRDLNDLIKFDTTGLPPVEMTIYENYFDVNPVDWITYAVAGNNFTFDGSYKVMVGNGYGGSEPSDCYLVSPGINLAGYSDIILTFKMWTKYTDSGLPNPFEVLISTNYSGSGDPTLATWTTLNCTLPAANSASWTSSGEISMDTYAGQKVYIGYHYRSSGTGSSTASKWEVDTFKMTGKK